MDSNLAQPWKETVSSEDSRDSNAEPSNSDATVLQTAHHVNCEDEKKSDAMKTNSMETTMKPQSNNGYGEGINDGIRFGNSSEGYLETLLINRHFHANGLNDKKVKAKGVETENRPLQVNGLNDKALIVGGKVVIVETENRQLHANGLNDKSTNAMEERGKVERKEKENSPLQDTGLNNKYIEMAAKWNGSRAASECKQWTRGAAWNESRAEAEYRFGNQRRMEAEYDERRNNYKQERQEWRNDDKFYMREHKSNPVFTVNSVYGEGSGDEDRFIQTNGLDSENPIYKLERVLRICNQEILAPPDRFGVIKRNPKAEHNPLLCNLKDWKATRMTEEAVTEILYGMLIKIPEYQAECEIIRGIGSHRITRFDLVETEVIQERIKAILKGSRSGRREESLAQDEWPVYDEGTKDYIESNRLLDYVSEFLWKARERPTDPYRSMD